MSVHDLERASSGERQPNSWQDLNRPRPDPGATPPPPSANDVVLLDDLNATSGSPGLLSSVDSSGNRDPIKLLLAGSIGFVAVVSVAMLAISHDPAPGPAFVTGPPTGSPVEPTATLAFEASDPVPPEPTQPARGLGMAVGLLDDQQQQVLRLYLAAFGRIPDQEGFAFWTEELRRGLPAASLAESFVATPEFQLRFEPLTDRERVAVLYRNVLDRDGDPDGVEFWTGQLESGVPIHALVVAFAESAESRVVIGNE